MLGLARKPPNCTAEAKTVHLTQGRAVNVSECELEARTLTRGYAVQGRGETEPNRQCGRVLIFPVISLLYYTRNLLEESVPIGEN
jgi:hypothetical protein